MATTRLVALEDVPLLAELLRLNREFLAPWDPIRPDDFFTADGQRRAIEEALERHANGTGVPHVILDGGDIAGRVTLSNIVGGPFQSCNLGVVPQRPRPRHRRRAGIEHNGFVRFGLAPEYLKVAGRSQDHAMYQALNPASS